MILKKYLPNNDYYQYYLSLHQNPKCRLFHFLGQIATIFFICFVIKNSFWILIPIIPFVVYPFAWSGHFLFEKNSPLAWDGYKDGGKTTIKAKICDIRMFFDILMLKLKIW